MSKCTAAQAVAAMEYWLGYCEKASSAYATTRDKSAFALNKGANNYTYAGYYCGIQGGAWCAMMVSTAIAEACGDSKATAKEVMYGLWPYSACNQLYEAAPDSRKGRRGAWTPIKGDVIVFSDNGSARSHTGMVYACDGKYVYTIEGNVSNMCAKRSYLLTSTYIWGYVRPDYADADVFDVGETETSGDNYGGAIEMTVHELSKGTAGREVLIVQAALEALGYDCGGVDGDFGKLTKAGVIAFQAACGLAQDGVVGAKTWAALFEG